MYSLLLKTTGGPHKGFLIPANTILNTYFTVLRNQI